MSRVHDEAWGERGGDPQPWEWGRRRELLLDELRDGERWLDLGCGTGRFLEVAPNAIGVDVSPAAIERARERGDARLMDSDQIPLGHGEVDLVWCSEVLGFVADPLGLLQECRRVLAPGGRVLLTSRGERRWMRTPDPRDLRLRFFTHVSLRELLEEAGFAARVEGRAWLVARGERV